MLLLFFAGLFLSLTGSLPPGLISLSVSQTSINRGFTAAVVLGLGAAFAEFFQAWSAALLTGWFMEHPAVSKGFQWASMPIFFILGIYFIFFSKPPSPPSLVSPPSLYLQFAKGIAISVFNLLAIPYWVVYCGWLRTEGWWTDAPGANPVFSLGVTIGTSVSLILYAWLGQIILKRSKTIARYIDTFIGVLFILLGLKSLYTVFTM